MAFDHTSDFAIDEAHLPHIQEIRSVFLFNRNEITYCCELTPSYWLIHLYDEVILTPDADESLSEDEKSAIYEAYEYAGSGSDWDRYVHCHEIDAMIRKRPRKRFTIHHVGSTGVSYKDVPYEEQIESLREHYSCNHCL
jgi:hypothetical protein